MISSGSPLRPGRGVPSVEAAIKHAINLLSVRVGLTVGAAKAGNVSGDLARCFARVFVAAPGAAALVVAIGNGSPNRRAGARNLGRPHRAHQCHQLSRRSPTPGCPQRSRAGRRHGRAVRITVSRMVDDQDLQGLDPYELMAAEAARFDSFFAHTNADDWDQPTRCAGWSRRDLLAHLAASEDYNQRVPGRDVQEFLAERRREGRRRSRVRERDRRPRVRRSVARPRSSTTLAHARAPRPATGFQARDGGDVDSERRRVSGSVAGLPPRVRVRDPRRRCRGSRHRGRGRGAAGVACTRFGRFALKEMKPDLTVDAYRRPHPSARRRRRHGTRPTNEFVHAVAARLPGDSGIDAETAAALSATP